MENHLLEVRLRCLEVAAKAPVPHHEGYAAGILESAQRFEEWVCSDRPAGKPTPPLSEIL